MSEVKEEQQVSTPKRMLEAMGAISCGISDKCVIMEVVDHRGEIVGEMTVGDDKPIKRPVLIERMTL